MKNRLIITIYGLILGTVVLAQDYPQPDSYYYLRGHEAMEEKKYEEAIEYFYNDIQENPKSGYSFSWIAYLQLQYEEYGKALSAANSAIKYLPKKDVGYVYFAYNTRGNIYCEMGDTVKAMNDYTSAIRIKPDDYRVYVKRGYINQVLKKNDIAEADYRKAIELEPGSVVGYMGLGSIANTQKRWNDAVNQFDHAIKLDNKYSQGYSFRAEAYLGLEKWNEATDDIVKALSLDWDRKAISLAMTIKDPAFTMLVSKMKIQSAKAPNEEKWSNILGRMYAQNNMHLKAIDAFMEANRRNTSSETYNLISFCYSKMGQYENALKNIDLALNMDSTDISFKVRKANLLYEFGDVSSAINAIDNVIVEQPDYAGGYWYRGWFKKMSDDIDGAIEDFSMCIVLAPEDSYALYGRGDLYMKQGKKELAEADFNRIIEIEDSPEKYNNIQHAYLSLGLVDKSIEAMDSIIARDKDRAASYYDASCLYAKMGQKQKALEYLKRSLELGYRRFAHIGRDKDLDSIRDMDEFKTLIQRYEGLCKEEQVSGLSESSARQNGNDTLVSEIPFIKEDGICKVKCIVNGLPLHFVFDTGASDVTLSMVEATFMMKNGYLSEKDVIGSRRYMDANGDISVGTIINLKDVSFGGQNLANVKASVVRTQNAPLLLGQSVLGRLGKIEVDNVKKVIKITNTHSY